MINHLALEQKETSWRRRNVKGKKSKIDCEQSCYCVHYHITMCRQKMSVGLVVAIWKREQVKLQGILLAEPFNYFIKAIVTVRQIQRPMFNISDNL